MEHAIFALIGLGASVAMAALIFGLAWKYLLYHPTPEEQVHIDRYYTHLDKAFRKSVR